VTSRRSLALLVAVLAIVVAGCGGGSSAAPTLAEYQESVVTTRDRVDFALARITNAKSKVEFLDRMDEAAVVIDDAGSDLDDTGAPQGFEDETDKLAGALHQLSVDLEATAHDIREPGSGLIGPGLQGLSFESWDDANLVLASLIGQGIKVELIARH